MTFIERIINENGTISERPYTAEEIAEVEQTRADAEQTAQEAAAKAAARAALLSRLGITENEAALLAGAL